MLSCLKYERLGFQVLIIHGGVNIKLVHLIIDPKHSKEWKSRSIILKSEYLNILSTPFLTDLILLPVRMRIILQSLSPSGLWFLLEIHPCPLSWNWYSGLIQFPVPCSGQFLLMMMMNSTLHLCQRQHLLDVIKITFSILCFHNELYTTCSRKALVYCPDFGVQSLSLERMHGGAISSKCQSGRKAVTVPWDFPHHCLVDYENVKKNKNLEKLSFLFTGCFICFWTVLESSQGVTSIISSFLITLLLLHLQIPLFLCSNNTSQKLH